MRSEVRSAFPALKFPEAEPLTMDEASRVTEENCSQLMPFMPREMLSAEILRPPSAESVDGAEPTAGTRGLSEPSGFTMTAGFSSRTEPAANLISPPDSAKPRTSPVLTTKRLSEADPIEPAP